MEDAPEVGQTEIPNSPTSENNGRTEIDKSPTRSKTGRPSRSTPEPAKWTIRGIEPETRRIIEKAADRSGKTLGQFFNDELREAASNLLKKGNQVPARPEDLVVDLFEKLRSELKAEQADELKTIREALERRPASLREWIFGKRS